MPSEGKSGLVDGERWTLRALYLSGPASLAERLLSFSSLRGACPCLRALGTIRCSLCVTEEGMDVKRLACLTQKPAHIIYPFCPVTSCAPRFFDWTVRERFATVLGDRREKHGLTILSLLSFILESFSFTFRPRHSFIHCT